MSLICHTVVCLEKVAQLSFYGFAVDAHKKLYFQAYFCTYIGFAESETGVEIPVPETFQFLHYESDSNEDEVDDDSELSDVDEHWDHSSKHPAPPQIRMKVQPIHRGNIKKLYKDHEKVIK